MATAPGQLLTSHRLVRLYWLTPMKGLHLLFGPERPFCLEAVPPCDLLLGLETAEADGVAVLAAAAGDKSCAGAGACCCVLASVVTTRPLPGVCPAVAAASGLPGPSGSVFTAAALMAPSAAADRVGILLAVRALLHLTAAAWLARDWMAAAARLDLRCKFLREI
jgi:hypothetical protein